MTLLDEVPLRTYCALRTLQPQSPLASWLQLPSGFCALYGYCANPPSWLPLQLPSADSPLALGNCLPRFRLRTHTTSTGFCCSLSCSLCHSTTGTASTSADSHLHCTLALPSADSPLHVSTSQATCCLCLHTNLPLSAQRISRGLAEKPPQPPHISAYEPYVCKPRSRYLLRREARLREDGRSCCGLLSCLGPRLGSRTARVMRLRRWCHHLSRHESRRTAVWC